MAHTNGQRLTVGTRGSALALRQTELVLTRLAAHNPFISFQIVTIRTEGDRARDKPISELGDKGVFVQPLAEALSKGEIDLAVHSLKDVPAEGETGLEIAAYLERGDPRDALISREGLGLGDLPAGSRVGTSSLRRQAQLRAIRPDVLCLPIRGNVDTRLQKLEDGQYDALILAAAGLIRLGLAFHIAEYLDPDDFTPDAGQAIIAVQTRPSGPAAEVARQVDDPSARVAATAERSVVRGLEADCRSPVGAYALIEGDSIRLRAMASSADLTRLYRLETRGPQSQAEVLGLASGRHLLSQTRP